MCVGGGGGMCVRACMHACMPACVCVCVCACMHACVCVCVCSEETNIRVEDYSQKQDKCGRRISTLALLNPRSVSPSLMSVGLK